MAHLKHNHMLHPQILLYPLHALLALRVLERVLVLAIEPVHDVPLKVLEEVHLRLELVGVDGDRVRLAHEDGALAAGGDVVEVSAMKGRGISIDRFRIRRKEKKATPTLYQDSTQPSCYH